MKELLKYLAEKTLPHGEECIVEEETAEDGTVRLTLTTHPEDIGLAIGKSGKMAFSLRELLKIKAIHQGKRVYLSIKSSADEETVPKKD